jgi:arginyl-tRNA synthetase
VHQFHEKCPVLKAPDADTRQSRLVLSDLAARTLRLGLELLGVTVVERM